MDTVSIVLVSILATGTVMLLILLAMYVIKDKREANSEIKKLDKMRNRIDFLIMVHMEDEKLNGIKDKYPDLERDVEDYREARNNYFGIGTTDKGDESQT